MVRLVLTASPLFNVASLLVCYSMACVYWGGGGMGLVLLDWTYNRKNAGRNTSFQASCYQH